MAESEEKKMNYIHELDEKFKQTESEYKYKRITYIQNEINKIDPNIKVSISYDVHKFSVVYNEEIFEFTFYYDLYDRPYLRGHNISQPYRYLSYPERIERQKKRKKHINMYELY